MAGGCAERVEWLLDGLSASGGDDSSSNPPIGSALDGEAGAIRAEPWVS